NRSIIFSQAFICHRSGKYDSKKTVRLHQKPTKKIGCQGLIIVRCFTNSPGIVKITMEKNHSQDHVPGSDKDIRNVSLSSDVIKTLDQRLTYTRDVRSVLDDMLHQMEPAEARYRRPHYEDVYNLLRQKSTSAYKKDDDDHVSFDKWMEELRLKNYKIFIGNMHEYGPSLNKFAKGFQ
ncbi:hypothetical protein BC941DRAFT_487143, partial [Chlamydoabsidia padenii]